jgi:glycosyltransferase involved in cell wall biosynthesis
MENILETIKYSFVLPAYKANYLKEALDSILNQTYSEFELIIVNDASPENVEGIVKSYDDKRIQYYRNEQNLGGKDLVAQWNHSISFAKGEYLILASDDDIYMPDYLEKMDALVNKYPEVNVFRPRVKRVDNSGKILHIDGYQGEYLTQLEYVHAWTRQWLGSGIPFFVFRRQALLDIGGFVNYPLAWFSDDATVLKLAEKGVVIHNRDTLFAFRYSSENISTVQNSKKSLGAKLRATQMYYKEHLDFINNYPAKNAEEEHLIAAIRKHFPKMMRNNKVRSQLRASTFCAICGNIKTGASIGCVSRLFMIKCLKYPVKEGFKRMFARKKA